MSGIPVWEWTDARLITLAAANHSYNHSPAL